jgi:hypothetical protein
MELVRYKKYLQSFGVGHIIEGGRKMRYMERYRRTEEAKISRRDKGGSKWIKCRVQFGISVRIASSNLTNCLYV